MYSVDQPTEKSRCYNVVVSFLRSRSPAAGEMGKSRSPVRGRLCKQPSVEELELVSCQLEPKLEGRILQLTPVSREGNEHEDNTAARIP